MKKYDYLIVGSGLFGAVMAHELNKKGARVCVIDKRNHSGGNLHSETIADINVHLYGAHIFHTSDQDIWNYVNQFVTFNRYTNSPLANYHGELYNLPFNMNTFNTLWGVITPTQAREKIASQIPNIEHPQNLEEQALSLVGSDIYTKLIKDYTEKQWGRSARDLPAFIIKRLPVRYTYDNNYFNDTYQGIPIGGYNSLTDALLEGIDLRLNADYFADREMYDTLAKTVIFTGPIDAYYDYCFGPLDYRSLRFEHEILESDNFQGNAVINYTDALTPYTRIIEHKHFEFGTQTQTVITKEYPCEGTPDREPFYPINDPVNNDRYEQYAALSQDNPSLIFGGRLGSYRYYDMDKTIAAALKLAKELL